MCKPVFVCVVASTGQRSSHMCAHINMKQFYFFCLFYFPLLASFTISYVFISSFKLDGVEKLNGYSNYHVQILKKLNYPLLAGNPMRLILLLFLKLLSQIRE